MKLEDHYIQQPMFDAVTTINVENNIITNNTSPLGKEIYVKWKDTKHLFPNFDNNNWGDEDPSNPNIIDPNNVSNRIHPKIINHNEDLLYNLNFGLLNRYQDILDTYYPKFSEDFKVKTKPNENKFNIQNNTTSTNTPNLKLNNTYIKTKTKQNKNSKEEEEEQNNKGHNIYISNNILVKASKNSKNSLYKPSSRGNIGFSSGHIPHYSEDAKKVIEVFENNDRIDKSTNHYDLKYIISLGVIFLILLLGFSKRKNIFK